MRDRRTDFLRLHIFSISAKAACTSLCSVFIDTIAQRKCTQIGQRLKMLFAMSYSFVCNAPQHASLDHLYRLISCNVSTSATKKQAMTKSIQLTFLFLDAVSPLAPSHRIRLFFIKSELKLLSLLPLLLLLLRLLLIILMLLLLLLLLSGLILSCNWRCSYNTFP